MYDLKQMREWTGSVNNIANGYKQSRILFTAFSAGLFDLLETPKTAREIAKTLEWSERGAAMLLDGLLALGLTRKSGLHYGNTEMASVCLAKTGEGYQGNILQHNFNSWEVWTSLEERVRTGTCAPPGEKRTGQALRDFILGMSNIAKISAQEMLQNVNLERFTHILDLAGGPGSYAIAFLSNYPQMRATLFDRPEVIEIAQEQVALAGLSDRFNYICGDCLADDFGNGYDLVLMSNIIHSFSNEENALVVKKVFDALLPGGTLIVKDFILENDRLGPAFSLLFALHMLVHTPAGNTYTYDEIKSWTDMAGFGSGEVVSLTQQTRLWIVQKPC